MRSLCLILTSTAATAACVAATMTVSQAQQFQPWVTTEKPAKAPPSPPAAKPSAKVEAAKPESKPSPTISEWPKLLPKADSKADPKTPERWTAADIAEAQRSCVALLKGLDLVAVGATPILEGDECGAPAPLELISVGTSPQVTFSPPVTVTCEMAAALHSWITKDVQASARKHLGSAIVRVDTMSSYSCRNAYNRAHHKLSEHGKANAVDIRAFMAANANTAEVLASWGPTARDIQAQVAAAKAAEEKAKALAASKPANGGVIAVPPTGTALAPSAPAAVADAPRVPGVTIGTGGTLIPSAPPSIGLSTGFPPASRLGGPKPVDKLRPSKSDEPKGAASKAPTAVAETPLAGDKRTPFLRDIHASACKIFGTVLGPEANNAHRNHFHVDMAKRQQKSFCE